MMAKKKKAAKLVLDDDDEDWDDLVEEEEEIDDIIDDDEDEDLFDDEDDEEEEAKPSKKKKGSSRSKKRSGKAKPSKKKKSGNIFDKPPVKWTVRIFITLLVVFLLFAPLEPLVKARDEAGLDALKDLMRPFRTFPEWVEVRMEMSYDLSIRGGTAEMIDIQVAQPFDIPLESDDRDFIVQDVDKIIMTPAATGPTKNFNTTQNVLTGWKYNDMIPNVYQFKTTYDLKLYTYEWDLDRESSGDIDDIPKYYTDRYLGDDWPVIRDGEYIDDDHDGNPDLYRYHPSDPRIKNIAETLTEDEDTVYGKVESIYKWILEKFNYTNSEQRIRDDNVYFSMPKWATGCLSDWYGDCDDQSLLMASLCRSVGIPAWLEIGFLYDQVQDEWGGHGWFNVYIPKKMPNGTITKVIAPIDPVNSEFLFRDPFRITDWVDNGSYIRDDDGDLLYNLDDYYNFFSMKKPTFVAVEIDAEYHSKIYKEHGNIKKYVDQKIEPGNLGGAQQSVPELNPLLVLPALLALIAIPMRKVIVKRFR